MFRTLAAVALAAAVPAPLMADYTECKVIHNGPIQSNKTEQPFVRQPDTAALSEDKAPCKPAPVVVQGPGMAPNSTFTNDGEPPVRFSYAPKQTMKVALGQENIDRICGVPPCGLRFEGCTRGDVVALPDPWDASFGRIARHEFAHINGWPATHGE
jgi:hypothetical protein